MPEQDKSVRFNLFQLWLNLWQKLGGQGNPRQSYYDLLCRYSSPNRFYHNLGHLNHCLSELESSRYLAQCPEAIELAIWYHDVVYDTQRKDNEERSALMAVELISNAGLPKDLADRVVKLIMATKHVAIFSNPDTQLMMDIDLAILGQPQEVFDEYEKQIRQEYLWVPISKFMVRRSAILKSFLDRPCIYLTPFFHDQYEIQARENLSRSLNRLANRS